MFFPQTRHYRGSVAPYTGTRSLLWHLTFSVSKIPKTLVRSGFPADVIRVEGRLRPRLFLLLDFRPIKMPESCLTSYRISSFQLRLQIAPNGRFSFWAGGFLASLRSSAHRRSVGDTRAFCGGYLFSFSVVVVPGFCSMGFLLDRKF